MICGVLVSYNPNVVDFSNVIGAISKQVDLLLVVDNGSANLPCINNIVESYVKARVLPLNDNIGLAAAQNIAIAKAKEQGASHVILFDQDSVIGDGFIAALCECERELIASGKKVAAVGPSFFDPVSGHLYPATLYRGPFIKRVPLGATPIQATFIIASGCLIRMDVLNDVGLMKDELFIDYIDVEWSLRAQAKGYGVYIAPKARMAHTIGDKRVSICGRTISVHSPVRRYYLFRNSFYMLKLPYVPSGYKMRELVFNFIRFLVSLIMSEQKVTVLKYTYWAMSDAIRGKFGRCNHV